MAVEIKNDNGEFHFVDNNEGNHINIPTIDAEANDDIVQEEETDIKDNDAYEDIKLNKKIVAQIKTLLQSTLSTICTEVEHNLICLIEGELEKEVENDDSSYSDYVDSDKVIDDKEDGMAINVNIRQLFEYFNNVSEEISLQDGHTKDVIYKTNSKDQGEPSKGPNEST